MRASEGWRSWREPRGWQDFADTKVQVGQVRTEEAEGIAEQERDKRTVALGAMKRLLDRNKRITRTIQGESTDRVRNRDKNRNDCHRWCALIYS